MASLERLVLHGGCLEFELSGMAALILLRRTLLLDGEITVITHLSLAFMTWPGPCHMQNYSRVIFTVHGKA